VFLLVPAYPGSPGPEAIKRLCVYVHIGNSVIAHYFAVGWCMATCTYELTYISAAARNGEEYPDCTLLAFSCLLSFI